MTKIPKIIENMPIRYFEDGSFGIPRNNINAERILDNGFIRLLGELRWYPHITGNESIENLHTKFYGKLCYIVGKGESLNHLNSTHFPHKNAPIIGINQAIHYVEDIDIENQLFVMQQETILKDSCKPKKENTYLIISYITASFYRLYKKKYIFNPGKFGLPIQTYTIVLAIEIAKYLGSSELIMLCFDAYANKNYGYAKDLFAWAGNIDPTKRLEEQRSDINRSIKGIDVTWITPIDNSIIVITKDHDLASVDTPQPLLDSLEEHHELDPTQHLIF